MSIQQESSKMTKSQAGKLGAEKRKEKLGPAGLSASALKAARTIEERRPGFHALIGAKGGKAGGKKGGRGGSASHDDSDE